MKQHLVSYIMGLHYIMDIHVVSFITTRQYFDFHFWNFLDRYSGEEIEKKVTMFREMLISKEGVAEPVVDKDASGRPV